MSGSTSSSAYPRFAALAAGAVICISVGFAVGSKETALRPSSAIAMRFESAESVFYELSWPDGFLWMIDTNRDGVLDKWEFWKKSENGEFPVEFWARDRNSDRRLDEWYLRTGHDEGLLERDTDFDGVVDETKPLIVVRKYAPGMKE